MVQRVVVVDGNQIAAENLSNFIVGTYVGIGAIMYGLYWVVGYFAPFLLAEDIGILAYVIAPVAILLSAFFLLLVLLCAISFEDPVTQFVYSCGSSYLSVPLIMKTGVVGYSDTGEIISYALVFLFSFGLIKVLMKYPKILKTTKAIGGIAIFGFLSVPFWETTVEIIKSAGWL